MKWVNALAVALVWQVTVAGAADPNYFTHGQVLLASSSHQDTAWMGTPAFCRQYRIDRVLLPALAMMRSDPDYCFSMENTLHLMELLKAHPELRGEVAQRLKEGRLTFGALYNEAYESWMSGEELVRETYFGRRWIIKNLPGCDSKVYFNPDPPGRALQMQQVLARAGIPYMFISRFHAGLWRWESPDGSSVLAYSMAQYGDDLAGLDSAPADGVKAIHLQLDHQAPYYKRCQLPPAYCLVHTTDFATPKDFGPLIKTWNEQTATDYGEGTPPTMSYASVRGFFEAVDRPESKFDHVMGERPDVWVYITGPTHQELSSAKREAARLLPAAETFTTIACLLDGTFNHWPSAALDQAWMDEIYVDHGMGGKNGDITDEVFFSRVKRARDAGAALLEQALAKITARVKTDPRHGTPVTVFNDLSWSRSGAVEMELPAGVTGPVRVVDAAGAEVPSQSTLADSLDETNVAAATMGAEASADSVFSPAYGAEKAIDGRWNVCDPNPETGSSSKWNSGGGAGPHWLMVDFGRSRAIHQVVIRHEGVMGVFGGETRYNTGRFQIQSADSATGPWTDLVAPVTNNHESLTVHRFAPKTFRFLRLYITKGAQDDGPYARIYEVQAFEKIPPKARLLFLANEVPSLGYKTFYVVNYVVNNVVKSDESKKSSATGGSQTCENSFYRITLAPGGIKSIFDKQQGRELLKSGKFLGGEVFTMLSVAATNRAAGTDAGEFGTVPLPVMDESFDRVATHQPEWTLLENGPVRSVYQLEQPLADTTVRERLLVWHALKRLDCEVELENFNGRLWREFRLALPLAMDRPQLAAEVPFGIVRIGQDEIPMTGGGHSYGNLNYYQECRDIHPREVQDFVDASDPHGGLTMSSSVSVFDWIDPTTNASEGTILQPVLLASRKSCNGEGVWYPQAGDHHYRFALSGHSGGWRNGWRDGIAANHPLLPVVGVMPGRDANLPESKSFFSLSDSNVVISTLKKCEDDDSVIVRVFDIEGRDTHPSLKCFLPLRAARHTDIIEERGLPLDFGKNESRLPVGHNAIETFDFNF